MIFSIICVAALGFVISLYAFWLEQKVKREPDYKAACDISQRMSCTASIKSPYARIFYFSNSAIGMAYYAFVALLAWLSLPQPLLIATMAGVAGSIALAYVLYGKIKTVCLVCTSLYLINIVLLILAWTYR